MLLPLRCEFHVIVMDKGPFVLVQRADDMRLMQQKEQLSRRMGARYLPGGRAQQYHLSKSSLDACLLQLHTSLSHDWPASFVQVRPESFPSAQHIDSRNVLLHLM